MTPAEQIAAIIDGERECAEVFPPIDPDDGSRCAECGSVEPCDCFDDEGWPF